jgi:hypothetical protein
MSEDKTVNALPDVNSTPSESQRVEATLKTSNPSKEVEHSYRDIAMASTPLVQSATIPAAIIADGRANSTSTTTSSQSLNPKGKAKDSAAEGEATLEGQSSDGVSPVIVASPLPEQVENEQFWDLRMSWSGKVYEMKVGANDM